MIAFDVLTAEELKYRNFKSTDINMRRGSGTTEKVS
jgi:hypothetical protein